jgi:hypothetical protein
VKELSITVALSEGGTGLLSVQGSLSRAVDARERQDQVDNAVRAAEQLVREAFARSWQREDAQPGTSPGGHTGGRS